MKHFYNYSRAIALLLATLLVFVLMLAILLIADYPQGQTGNRAFYRNGAFFSGWTKPDGNPIYYDKLQNALLPAAQDGVIHMEKTLLAPTVEDDMLFFQTNAKAMQLYVDGVPVGTYQRPQREFAEMGMHEIAALPLRSLRAGQVLHLEIQCGGRSWVLLSQPFCGNASEYILYLMFCARIHLVIVVFLLYAAIVGSYFYVESVLRRNSALTYLYLTLLSLLSMLFVLSNSALAPLIFGSGGLRYYLSVLTFYLLPLPYLLALTHSATLNAGRLSVLAVGDLLLTLIALVLQALGVTTLYWLVPLVLLYFIVAYFAAFWRILRQRPRIYVQIAVGAAVMALYSLVSLVLVGLFRVRDLSFLYSYAIMFFFLCLLWRLVVRARENQKQARITEKLRQEKEIAESSALISQINSHFFFNTMNTIRALIKLDPDSAYRMTGNYCKFLRYRAGAVGLTSSLTPFSEELRAIEQLADVCLMRHGGQLRFVKQIETQSFWIPTLSVEPFVENAIEHGIFANGGSGTVTLRARTAEGGYLVEVEDDGCGFDPEALEKERSLGIRNVSARMAMFRGCWLKIDSKPGQGTRVRLFYPDSLGGEVYENDPGGRQSD